MSDISTIVPPRRDLRLRWLAVALIVLVTIIRLIYLFYFCPYDLAPDEAHYWDWSRHLALSYYSKGPLVAWIIRAGCELFGDAALSTNGTLMPAVRVPAVLCGSGLVAGLYVLTWQTYRNDKLAFAITLVANLMPHLTLCSTIMSIDPPFLCAWIWALVFGRWAMIDGRHWAWPIAGLFVSLGILAKYTMALWLVSAGLFVLFTPSFRPMLRQAGFWVMVAVAATSALPILIWNSQNDWVTFRHVAVQAGVAEGKKSSGIRWLGPFEYFAVQMAIMVGVWFVLWFIAMVRFRPSGSTPIGLRYLWWMSAPTFAVFAASSLRASGQPNWPVAAYLSGSVLSIALLSEIWRSPRVRLRRLVNCSIGVVVVIGTLATIALHDTRMYTGIIARFDHENPTEPGAPFRKYDPAARLKGSRYLAGELDAIRDRLISSGIGDPLLVEMRWDRPGLFGFYCKGHPQAYSIGLILRTDRHSQYDHWHPNPIDDAQEFHGRTFVIVGQGDPRFALKDAFAWFEEPFEIIHREHGRILTRWLVVVCHDFKGFDLSQLQGQTLGH